MHVTGVVLRGFPLRLFYAWEEHSDALLREYALVAGPDHPYSLADVSRGRAARVVISQAVRYGEGEGERPVTANIPVTLPDSVEPADFSMLQALLEDGHRRSREGTFLTLPSLPEIAGLRDWVCDQVVRQTSGEEPSAWDAVAGAKNYEVPLATWAGVDDLPADRAWLVGDDHNRIIAASAPAQQLLGWDDDLLGQRVLAVIPPDWRDAHVARVTHASVTGEHHLLGKPLGLVAWTREGTELPVTVTLERHPANGNRSVYVAWVQDARVNLG